MADDERELLALCKPRVVIQSGRSMFGDVRTNRLQDAASRCVSKGWIRFVRDDHPMQSTYEITQDGYAALTSASQ